MTTVEVVSIAAALFSITLAIFAIWMSFQQRRESQENYDNTKTVLSEIEKVMEKTEMLVSDNFQNLLKSITDQQNRLVESLAPKPSAQDRYVDLFVKMADDPEKLSTMVDVISKISASRPQTTLGSTDLLTKLAAAQKLGGAPQASQLGSGKTEDDEKKNG